MRVIAVRATQNYSAREFRVAEFPVRTFAAGGRTKTGGVKIGDELSDFARHAAVSN